MKKAALLGILGGATLFIGFFGAISFLIGEGRKQIRPVPAEHKLDKVQPAEYDMVGDTGDLAAVRPYLVPA